MADVLKFQKRTDRLRKPDWEALREMARRLADYKCSLCGSPERPETHHNVYLRYGAEKLADIICLCSRCHAFFEFIKLNMGELNAWWTELSERTGSHRVAIEDVAEWFERKRREQLNMIGGMEQELELMLAMTGAEAESLEWDRRNAA